MSGSISWLTKMYIAHRGFHNSEFPENSVGSFESAIQEGFAIELDLQVTKDNKVVVFHDEHLERMTGVNKNIRECTYNEIKPLRLLKTEEPIPLFSDVLELVNGKVPLMVELKNKRKVGNFEKSCYTLLENYQGEFVIQSFNPYSVGWFVHNAPSVGRGQLSGSFKGESLSFYKRLILSNLLLNNVSKPHFINYEIDYMHKLPNRYKNQKQIPILGWTARSEEKYRAALKICDNVVFEGFNPKYLN